MRPSESSREITRRSFRLSKLSSAVAPPGFKTPALPSSINHPFPPPPHFIPHFHPALQSQHFNPSSSIPALQSMCTILHRLPLPKPAPRARRAPPTQLNILTARGLPHPNPNTSRPCHFGSANALSSCSEEAATFETHHSNFSTSHRSFLPRKRRPTLYPLIPANLPL